MYLRICAAPGSRGLGIHVVVKSKVLRHLPVWPPYAIHVLRTYLGRTYLVISTLVVHDGES